MGTIDYARSEPGEDSKNCFLVTTQWLEQLLITGTPANVDQFAMQQAGSASTHRSGRVQRMPADITVDCTAARTAPALCNGSMISAPIAPATIDGEKRRKFVVVLMTRESLEFTRALEVCRMSCDPYVYDICFQRDGSRHLTLLTLNGITAADAQRVTFDMPVSLPMRLTFSGLSQKSVLLLPDAASKRRLAPLLCRGNYGCLPSSGSVQTQNFIHLSLFRVRSRPHGYLQEFEKVRAACGGITWGVVEGTCVVIKEVGAEYTKCRVLAE
jgi:hypothetical protein